MHPDQQRIWHSHTIDYPVLSSSEQEPTMHRIEFKIAILAISNFNSATASKFVLQDSQEFQLVVYYRDPCGGDGSWHHCQPKHLSILPSQRVWLLQKEQQFMQQYARGLPIDFNEITFQEGFVFQEPPLTSELSQQPEPDDSLAAAGQASAQAAAAMGSAAGAAAAVIAAEAREKAIDNPQALASASLFSDSKRSSVGKSKQSFREYDRGKLDNALLEYALLCKLQHPENFNLANFIDSIIQAMVSKGITINDFDDFQRKLERFAIAQNEFVGQRDKNKEFVNIMDIERAQLKVSPLSQYLIIRYIQSVIDKSPEKEWNEIIKKIKTAAQEVQPRTVSPVIKLKRGITAEEDFTPSDLIPINQRGSGQNSFNYSPYVVDPDAVFTLSEKDEGAVKKLNEFCRLLPGITGQFCVEQGFFYRVPMPENLAQDDTFVSVIRDTLTNIILESSQEEQEPQFQEEQEDQKEQARDDVSHDHKHHPGPDDPSQLKRTKDLWSQYFAQPRVHKDNHGVEYLEVPIKVSTEHLLISTNYFNNVERPREEQPVDFRVVDQVSVRERHKRIRAEIQKKLYSGQSLDEKNPFSLVLTNVDMEDEEKRREYLQNVLKAAPRCENNDEKEVLFHFLLLGKNFKKRFFIEELREQLLRGETLDDLRGDEDEDAADIITGKYNFANAYHLFLARQLTAVSRSSISISQENPLFPHFTALKKLARVLSRGAISGGKAAADSKSSDPANFGSASQTDGESEQKILTQSFYDSMGGDLTQLKKIDINDSYNLLYQLVQTIFSQKDPEKFKTFYRAYFKESELFFKEEFEIASQTLLLNALAEGRKIDRRSLTLLTRSVFQENTDEFTPLIIIKNILSAKPEFMAHIFNTCFPIDCRYESLLHLLLQLPLADHILPFALTLPGVKALINVPNGDGYVPLAEAVKQVDLLPTVVQALLNCGANSHAVTPDRSGRDHKPCGLTPVELLARRKWATSSPEEDSKNFYLDNKGKYAAQRQSLEEHEQRLTEDKTALEKRKAKAEKPCSVFSIRCIPEFTASQEQEQKAIGSKLNMVRHRLMQDVFPTTMEDSYGQVRELLLNNMFLPHDNNRKLLCVDLNRLEQGQSFERPSGQLRFPSKLPEEQQYSELEILQYGLQLEGKQSVPSKYLDRYGKPQCFPPPQIFLRDIAFGQYPLPLEYLPYLSYVTAAVALGHPNLTAIQVSMLKSVIDEIRYHGLDFSQLKLPGVIFGERDFKLMDVIFRRPNRWHVDLLKHILSQSKDDYNYLEKLKSLWRCAIFHWLRQDDPNNPDGRRSFLIAGRTIFGELLFTLVNAFSDNNPSYPYDVFQELVDTTYSEWKRVKPLQSSAILNVDKEREQRQIFAKLQAFFSHPEFNHFIFNIFKEKQAEQPHQQGVGVGEADFKFPATAASAAAPFDVGIPAGDSSPAKMAAYCFELCFQLNELLIQENISGLEDIPAALVTLQSLVTLKQLIEYLPIKTWAGDLSEDQNVVLGKIEQLLKYLSTAYGKAEEVEEKLPLETVVYDQFLQKRKEEAKAVTTTIRNQQRQLQRFFKEQLKQKQQQKQQQEQQQEQQRPQASRVSFATPSTFHLFNNAGASDSNRGGVQQHREPAAYRAGAGGPAAGLRPSYGGEDSN